MLNKYSGTCFYCQGNVPAKGGECFKVQGRWAVAHLPCFESRQPEVVVTRFSSGAEIFQNRRGRCEDAPCCGCCS
jgi:hypothetical protein